MGSEMWIKKTSQSAEKVITTVSRIISYGAAGFLIVMMLLTVTDVILRYIFNRPILGSVEITEYLIVAVVFLGVAWCTAKGRNAKVDLVVGRLPQKTQALFDSVTCLLSLGVSLLLSWQAIRESRDIWIEGKASHMLELPAYPFYFVMAFGLFLLCLVLITNAVKHIVRAIKI